MGMAASQARLLSITSRMADNELRSQIINNSKMRLATESSKVSEDYINALNSATMMMSNYDTAGESQYQKLTFNSLTSYSSYNNQYGLVNANGNIMVSEHDAAIYRDVIRTGGGLDEYLAAYGLEYTSTFFTEETLGGTTVPITYEDMDGEVHELGSYTIEELEEMYYGSEDGTIIGYNNALQSAEYVNYSDYYNELVIANDNYDAKVSKDINDYIFNDDWDKYYKEYIKGDTKGSVGDYQDAFNWLNNYLNTLLNTGYISNDNEWVQDMGMMLNQVHFFESGGARLISSVEVTSTTNDDGKIVYNLGNLITLTETDEEDVYQAAPYNEDIECEFQPEGGKVTINETTILNGGGVGYTEIETDEETGETHRTYYFFAYEPGSETATRIYTIGSASEMQNVLTELYLEFQAGIRKAVNRDKFGAGTDEQKAYNAALDKFIELVFGNNLSAEQKSEIEQNYAKFENLGELITWAEENGLAHKTDAYNIIEQIFILDQVFNTYGEPSEGWIDTNNPDENADAKVQWYTNLYNRMEKGYVVLEDGLASSNEWIEFAFESGLVTMEQVDSNNNWVSTIYTNCSDITEVTDDAAVARAEAEYNKAMNNIENKDKRFDMELKNIDTEHNSLQTEYDSVKSVIDKNIERSFKIYS